MVLDVQTHMVSGTLDIYTKNFNLTVYEFKVLINTIQSLFNISADILVK